MPCWPCSTRCTFIRFLCPDCGHERLLAFTCKGRHLCPACHQRRIRQTAEWISISVCHEVPHRQFVFTIPKILRGTHPHPSPPASCRHWKTAVPAVRENRRPRLLKPPPKSFSFPRRPSKPPAPCAPCGATSSLKSGVPIRSNALAASPLRSRLATAASSFWNTPRRHPKPKNPPSQDFPKIPWQSGPESYFRA